MRTPEQIENLRFILRTLFGASVQALTDKDVDDWANNLQKHINNLEPDKSTLIDYDKLLEEDISKE